MKKPTDENNEIRNKIIGLGNTSYKKSYYPELQKKISELNLYKAILKQIDDYILIYEIKTGIILDTNDSFQKYINNDIIGEKISEVMCDNFWENVKAVSGIKSFEYEFKDKEVYEISVDIISLQDRNIGIAIFRNITHKKNAELLKKKYFDELETEVKKRTHDINQVNIDLIKEIKSRIKVEEKLSYNEIKFRSIIENSPDGVVIVNQEGDIIAWNKS